MRASLAATLTLFLDFVLLLQCVSLGDSLQITDPSSWWQSSPASSKAVNHNYALQPELDSMKQFLFSSPSTTPTSASKHLFSLPFSSRTRERPQRFPLENVLVRKTKELHLERVFPARVTGIVYDLLQSVPTDRESLLQSKNEVQRCFRQISGSRNQFELVENLLDIAMLHKFATGCLIFSIERSIRIFAPTPAE
jgi:hypothetical protein